MPDDPETTDGQRATARPRVQTKPEIVDLIEGAACKLFDGSFPGTEKVKGEFRDLGQALGFKVASHGRTSDYGEWLYDLAWFEEDAERFLVRTSFVMECEARADPHLDGDFQKLIQARADVRRWIANAHSSQAAEFHIRVCRDQIARFSGTIPGDVYVLVVYGPGTPKPIIERITSN